MYLIFHAPAVESVHDFSTCSVQHWAADRVSCMGETDISVVQARILAVSRIPSPSCHQCAWQKTSSALSTREERRFEAPGEQSELTHKDMQDVSCPPALNSAAFITAALICLRFKAHLKLKYA